MAHDHLEVERSWVIKAVPDKSLIAHSVYHEIGYLFHDPGELRVYAKKLLDGWKYGITVKSDGDLARQEWEDKEFPEWAFNIVWPKTKTNRIYKTRYYIDIIHNNIKLLIEVDEYLENCEDLIRMECEFPSQEAAESFWLPSWIEGFEVTNDSRFKNKNLARLSREEFKALKNSKL